MALRLNPPTKMVFYISLVVALVALIAAVVPLGLISKIAVWLALIAYALLAAGNTLKGF